MLPSIFIKIFCQPEDQYLSGTLALPAWPGPALGPAISAWDAVFSPEWGETLGIGEPCHDRL